jgi:hypothetical protein
VDLRDGRGDRASLGEWQRDGNLRKDTAAR